MSKSLLMIGGDSEVAAAAGTYLRERGHSVISTTRRRERVTADRPFLDLSESVEDWAIPDCVDAACLCAAVARLNDCAREPVGSAKINVSGTVALARKLLAQGISVLFLSTDKVFDGERAHVPADAPPCPVSEYGRQKAAAEAALGELRRAGAPAAILRLAKVVTPGMALLRQWIAELNGGQQVRAFHDMMMAPTPIALVAAAIEHLLAAPTSGIFQLTGPRDVDYGAVARHLAEEISADPALIETVSAYSIRPSISCAAARPGGCCYASLSARLAAASENPVLSQPRRAPANLPAPRDRGNRMGLGTIGRGMAG